MRPARPEQHAATNPPKPLTNAAPQVFLADCMVDADSNSGSRAGRARGKAIGISALAQACLLTLFLIVPLFATNKLISVTNAVPIAPYGGMPRKGTEAKPRDATRAPNRTGYIITDPRIYVRPTITNQLRQSGDESARGESGPPEIPSMPWGSSTGDPNALRTGLIPGSFGGPQPPMPEPEKKSATKPIAVSEFTALAQLIHRIEPVYPRIALYSHTEGTVQLRAIIGRDGIVRDLHALSGNAVLAFAAEEAVKQWRFRPTILNGQPVEVDTFITVVFKITQ
jgi:TonB family protein